MSFSLKQASMFSASAPPLMTGPLARPLGAACERWCRMVARHPWPFLLAPVLTTVLLGSGALWRFRVVRGVNYLYSALDAPWKQEHRAFMDNWASRDDRFYPGRDALLRPGLFIIASARDGGNVLRARHARALQALIDWVTSVPVEAPDASGSTFTFHAVCLHYPPGRCFGNENARLVAQMFSDARGDAFANPFNVTYPLYRAPVPIADEPLMDLSRTLGGVRVTQDGMRRIRSARAWMLVFQLRHSALSSQFEARVSERIRRGETPESLQQLLNLSYYHSGTFDRELAENAVQLAPKFAATFALLVLFALLCTLDLHWVRTPLLLTHVPAVDWVRSKPLVGLAGVLSTLMAICSAVGALRWADVTFVDMCAVMPFLSLTIGIDDTFLMLAAWRATPAHAPVEKRIAHAMRHAAVSITITSLTDVLAFLIGSIAPLPAVIYFCYYSAAAILFIYLHFMTFFVAALALQGRWERRARHCVIGRDCVTQADSQKSLWRCMLLSGSATSLDSASLHWSQHFFSSIYASVLTHWSMRTLATLAFCAYAAFAALGMQRLTVGFKLINIVSFDARARHFLQTRSDLFPEDVQRLELAALRAPQMGKRAERRAFLQVLKQLEGIRQCVDASGTAFWWTDWRNTHAFNRSFDDAKDLDEKSLGPFLRAHPRHDYDVLRTPDGRRIRAFRFSMQLRARVTRDDAVLVHCARRIRAVCKRDGARFDLRSYSPLWNLADQFDIIWPQTLQDLYISVGVMAFVSLLIIPSLFSAVIVALNILSIGLGVIGFMAHWGVHLDPTSMITIAMSVGFSVDFAAHISFAYVSMVQQEYGRAKLACPMDCLRGCLASVGWPISQASFSVLLGISPLAMVHTYIIQTCFKTCLLVIVFGWLHALVFLPLAMMQCHRIYNWWWTKTMTTRRPWTTNTVVLVSKKQKVDSYPAETKP